MAVVFTKEVEVNEGSSVNICMAFKNPVVFFLNKQTKTQKLYPVKSHPVLQLVLGFARYLTPLTSSTPYLCHSHFDGIPSVYSSTALFTS